MGVPELEALDAPDTNSSCERRSVSTTGPQALTFLNGDFAWKQARHLQERVSEEAGVDPVKQISRVFQLVLGRFASGAEIAAAREGVYDLAAGLPHVFQWNKRSRGREAGFLGELALGGGE